MKCVDVGGWAGCIHVVTVCRFSFKHFHRCIKDIIDDGIHVGLWFVYFEDLFAYLAGFFFLFHIQ